MKNKSITNSEIKKLIKEKVTHILKNEGIKLNRIILFGSRARGDWDKYSDWDILVIIENQIDKKHKMSIAHQIRKALAEDYIPCDVIIKSEKELDYYKNFYGTVTYEALKEGIEL